MNDNEINMYKARLVRLQEALEREIREASDTKPILLDGSQGRLTRSEALHRQQMALELRQQKQERLLRVNAAFLRIAQGTYGLCARCREPIAPKRLEAIPDVVLCVHCAETPRRRE